MKINTALILCAGYGKRLNPITLDTPKPLLKLKNVTMLEYCINLIINLKIKKIIINTFYLGDQISKFIKDKKFSAKIEIVEDGKEILNTGGGILNMMNHLESDNFLVFNPDTLWSQNYISDIIKMQNYYTSNKLNNILLLTNKELSFDKNLKGDFELDNSLIKKGNNNFIFIGCQILNKNLFANYEIRNFSIKEIWNDLLKKKQLNGFKTFNKFYHLTDLDTFKKLKDF